MTAGNEQIVIAYEQLNLTPEQIAAEQDLDILSVKACLLQFSIKYKNDLKKESSSIVSTSNNSEVARVSEKLGFTEYQEQMALDTIANLAAYSEDERVQLKAASYIRDDRQSRLDFATKFGTLNINVLEFNSQLKRAMECVSRNKSSSINVDSEVEVAA